MKKGSIKCGGGLILFGDGTFSFFVELHVYDEAFIYEHIETFSDDFLAQVALENCVESFPEIVNRAASQRNFDLVEAFCHDWKLLKVDDFPSIESQAPTEQAQAFH